MARSGAWTAAPAAAHGGMASIIPSRKRFPLLAPLYGTVSATAVAAALLWPASPAQAGCAPLSGLASGTTVTCSGNTPNQDAPNGYGTGAQANNTVNVTNNATVTGTNA